MLRLVLAACVTLAAACGQTGVPAQADYSVLYTGKLFGYFRYPDLQTGAEQGCPDPSTVSVSKQVELFRAAVRQMTRSNQLLVSMGENFAPDLLSRAVRDGTPATDGRALIDKGLVGAEQKRLRSDNVACFLRLAGFDAIVPGQQDFYYGPERLRQLASFLAAPGTASYKPVHMLAANLIVSSTVRKQNPRLEPGALREPVSKALDKDSPVHFNLPSAVMPWLQRVTLDGGALANLQVYDCRANEEDPQDFWLPSESRGNCRKLPADLYMSGLEAGSNHALCAVYSETGALRTSCQLFSVQYPLLSDEQPYWAPADQNLPVIFGVLDPAIVSYIGQLSDVWRNVDPRFDTTAQVADAIEVLRQSLDACDADSRCRGRRKILLAQMPNYRASQLAAKLHEFHLVIAQPDEDHATGNQTIEQTDEHPAPYLLTPGIAFRAAHREALNTNLRRADYRVAAGSYRVIANRVMETDVTPAEGTCRTCTLDQAVTRTTGEADRRKGYEALALRSMQEFCGADVAFLQHRDVFTGFEKAVALWPSDFHPSPQDLLDEALWKGDFTFCVPLKGATIKKVLDESAAFDKQDRDNLSIETEKGRGLSTLGIQTDAVSGVLSIRGQTIEDNKLYGAAMTDYLAFGNTGYPELSSEAIQPVVRVVSLKRLNRLTGLACLQLPSEFTHGSCRADEISASDYFAAIGQRPFDTSRGVTAWLELRKWLTHPLPEQPNAATLFEKPQPSFEAQAERRPLWWFTLQNLSLGYNLNFIRGSDKEVPGNFVGNNSFSQLSTPESSQLNFWVRGRGGYSFPRYIDFYASAELKYSQLAVRTSLGNGNFGEYQLTLGTNLLRAETGINSKPVSRRVPIRLLLSEDLLTQFATPFQQFAAPLACGTLPCPNGATTLTRFLQPKNYLVVTRFGARLQNAQSWLEAGREYGQNIDLPFSYSIQDLASTVPLECPVAQGLTLSNCVSTDPLFTAQSRLNPHLRTQHVAGWFANFHTAVPLWRNKLQLVADSYGETFDRRSDDTSYNTRFYEDLTLALKVPIWGNLSFVPQVEAFYYQSKVLPNTVDVTTHYLFVTTSVTLQYAFDWHRGVGIFRALRYPGGVSTGASNTTPRP